MNKFLQIDCTKREITAVESLLIMCRQHGYIGLDLEPMVDSYRLTAISPSGSAVVFRGRTSEEAAENMIVFLLAQEQDR